MEKLSSTKPVPGAKKFGNCCAKASGCPEEAEKTRLIFPLRTRDQRFEARYASFRASQVVPVVKNLPADAGNHLWLQETWIRPLCGEDPLEEGIATHSSIPTWRIPWTEESGRLQSMGFQKSDMAERLTLSFLSYTYT